MDPPIGLREVVPNQTLPERCKDFTISTGGSQSTLQDVKLPDCSGGFTYSDQTRAQTRNRIILWRTSHDILDLTEVSLDWNLTGNRIRYRFQDTPVLSGVSIHETFHHVVILVSTVSSVHKLVFPHPSRMHKQDFQMYHDSDDGIPSIFNDASSATPKDHYHVIPGSGVGPLPHTSASWLDADDEAIFALASPVGGITLVKLGNMKGIVTVNNLKCSSYLGRLWDNIGGMLTSARNNDGSEAVLSLVLQPIQNDVYVFALCKDQKVRMWLTSSYDCVMVADVLSNQQQPQNRAPLQLGAQNHMLRKVIEEGKENNFTLAAFLCFAEHSQFCILRPVRSDGQFSLKRLATVYAPEYDLIDYSVTPDGRIVALWTNPDGVPMLRYTHFDGNSATWTDVILESPLDPYFAPDDSQFDPRQVYLKQLFYPGRFSIQTLSKTVNIYRRSVDMSLSLVDDTTTVSKLKEQICAAVEVEIQNQVTEYEISDEEHIALSHAAWSRFYSCAVQYHETGLVPMGLIVNDRSGLITIIKKNNFSFVRPIEALEHLVLNGGTNNISGPELFHDTPILREDPLLAQDVVNLMKAISLVNEKITGEMVDEFNNALSRLVTPDNIAKKIIIELLTSEHDNDDVSRLSFIQELGSKLQQIGDVAEALKILLSCLELDSGIVSQYPDFDSSMPFDDEDHRRCLFASNFGRSVVAESLKQVVQSRFALTRNVIALQLIMLECGFAEEVPSGTVELIHSTFLPRSVVMAHCYFVLSWISETNSTAPPPDSLEHGLRQMAVLKISGKNTGAQHAAQVARNSQRPMTLSELFLVGPGAKSRLLLTSDTDHQASWQTVLMPLVNINAQLLWPRCAVSTFQEFLLASCQHMQIQEYVRLLSTWCDWNCHSRQFMLGSALLNMGEPDKACSWLIQAGGGIGSDPFLMNHLFGPEDESLHQCSADRLTVMYFLKVIHLFEQFGYFDHVIELAKTAIAICNENDQDKTTLCFTLFSYHLKLGHYDKAYDAMVTNPDQSRRKDSLRQFVVTLFERKELKQLAFYPYVDMFEDLENIIESRARSVDLSVNNYYDFLYSFHISKENYRKAAYVMYECAMRLSTETFSQQGLEKQVQCFLACLNSLRLVNPNYAWIVKPVLKVSPSSTSMANLPPGVSPKHSYDGEMIIPASLKPKMDVLEAADIQKELQLVSARLKLANYSSKRSSKRSEHQGSGAISGPGLSANDALALLVSANLYTDGVNIAKAFKLDYRPIVEGLASRCVYLSRAKGNEQDAAWDWLAENNTNNSPSSTSVDAAWHLLKELVLTLEVKGQSGLKKAVATRLLTLNTPLPTWLVTDYKMINAAELIHIYLIHGYVLLASKVACEYIEAVQGNGKEYFGLKTALHTTSPPVWLPFNLFDQLLLELKEHSDEPIYQKHYIKLNKTLDNYLNTVKNVSKDMITVRRIF